MRRLILTSLIVLLTTAPAASAQAPKPDERIAAGVVAGGVDVGGLTVEEATTKLRDALERRLTRDVVVKAGNRSYRLTAEQGKVVFDAERTAKRALYEGRKRPETTTPATGGGATAGVDVGLALEHSQAAVQAFAADVQARSTRKARNATLKITVRKMVVRRARVGRQLDAAKLAAAIDAALADPGASRRLRAKLLRVRPAVNANDLVRRNRTVLTADRSTFKLRLFKNLKLRKTYGIAVGQAGYGTPAGQFSITNKQVNPAWHVPNSDWAGGLAGQVIPGGAPNNPLKARWLGVTGSVGIHGTGEPWSIGTAASHGCLRMKVPDVIDLYPRVPVGTPILIK
ncbi:L,D-transpeptidase/peptidoglycan binding protein [Svornostia abyssi]|uniref:L,D-transpeptidase/peptidoglycan binding protein n=1 Tax=Svornostia abyssi TaxID=2898438 RepID=A0ABY5PI14_9ACTN|nr:L,D-transpeptidase/peptidoglycan binding protein [Parviterribacteraceae bacterium J379]